MPHSVTIEQGFLPKQAQVMTATPFNVLYIGGAGSGKTFVGAWWCVWRALENPKGLHHLIVAPTYPIIQAVVQPALRRVFGTLGIVATYNRTDKCWTLPGGRLIWIRSADDPDKMIGANVCTAWCDESAQFSEDMIKRITQRVRDPGATKRQILFTSTPEGTRTALYKLEREADEKKDSTVLVIRSNTFENIHMPEDWRRQMELKYADDPAGRRQYIEGIATDPTGNIYTALKAHHITTYARQPRFDRHETVVGGDFNVHWMVSVVGAWEERRNRLHIWGEVVSKSASGTSTSEHYKRVAQYIVDQGGGTIRDQKVISNPGNQVVVAIDASGKSLHSSAVMTDEAAVRNNGFSVWHMAKNPDVQDRIASVNEALAAGKLLIDPRGAPETLRALKEHSWDAHGQPQKRFRNGEFQADHYMDALGYLVYRLIPLRSLSAWRSS